MNNNFERNETNSKTEMLIGFCHGASKASLDEKISDTFNYIRTQIVEIYHLINKDEKKSISMADHQELLKKPISFLNLTMRTENCLFAEKIETVEELISCSEIQLLKTPNLGKKSLKEIITILADFGLSLSRE